MQRWNKKPMVQNIITLIAVCASSDYGDSVRFRAIPAITMPNYSRP
jgi:hypothetical protein